MIIQLSSNNSNLFKLFYCTQFICQIVLSEPLIEPYQVLQLRASVDQRAKTIKGYSAFSKAPALLKTQHPIV